jgi:GrpB-like predicted nucleotidyltransferase (UPF0157 family)
MSGRLPIEIVLYRKTWPDEFLTIATALRHALGDHALRIDHIGSTSVPNLSAKDIIDIQITVKSLDPAVELALTSLGYQRVKRIKSDHIPPGSPENPDEWVKWFFRAPPNQRPTNTHVRVIGRANQIYPLLFRDYLRANPATAEAYARVKIALARYHANDIDAYLAIKDPVCDIIMDGAKAWAEKTGWKLGKSDY